MIALFVVVFYERYIFEIKWGQLFIFLGIYLTGIFGWMSFWR
jgi:hypothetical protein